jgi:hypothetical protein
VCRLRAPRWLMVPLRESGYEREVEIDVGGEQNIAEVVDTRDGGAATSSECQDGDISVTLRVRIPCEFVETEIVSMDFPSCSMMG